MKNVRVVFWWLWVILSGYVVAWTFGLFVLGPLFIFFVITGRVRIHGYWNLVFAVLRGRLMILMNHPTLFFETFGIATLLFPWYLFVPWCFVWSMPDRRLLDLWKMPGWVRTLLRCIPIDRTNRVTSGTGGIDAVKVLQLGFVVVGHLEGGRTFGEANRNKIPLERKGRRMQKAASNLTRVAFRARARILPGWVQVQNDKPVSFCTSFRRMFGAKNAGHRPVIYSFRRKTYHEVEPFRLVDANGRAQNEILGA